MIWDDVTNSYIEDGTSGFDPYAGDWENSPVNEQATQNLLNSTWFQSLKPEEITKPEEANALVKFVQDKFGEGAAKAVKGAIFNEDGKTLNLATLATGAAGIYGLLGGNEIQTGGYNKPIPKLTATREQIPYADPNRRPGEAGRSYFTNTQYTAPENAAAAQTAAKTQAQGIAAAVPQRAAQVNPYQPANYTPTPYKPAWNPAEAKADTTTAASGVAQLLPVQKAEGFKPMAHGGLAAGGFVVPADVVAHLGNGSSSAGLALLAAKLNAKPIKGKGDGMSDSIPTHIDGKEKALVANDEAYIDPQMVKRIGGGNTKSGANKLLAMMEKIRKARTGNPKQGKRINPEKFMPGGIAQLAGGGEIQRFNTGAGGTANTVTPGPLTTPAATPLGTSTSSSLSPYAGDYVTNYLGKGQALAEAPYQSFQGPLTAGASDLQNQAFAGIGAAAQEGYKPTTYQGGTFGAQEAQQYMNPYLSAALNPQLDEMRRQAGITRVADAGRMTQAGAFGGSRQAIMESEGSRNLLDKQGQAIGTGYQTAYDKAVQQFNTEQDRRLGAEKSTEASRQYSADYGLKSLGDAASLGAVQRGIETEGINADKTQFEEERDYPLKMVQYQKDLLQGLPITSAATTANTTGISNLSSQILGLQGLYNQLAGLGQTTATTTSAAK